MSGWCHKQKSPALFDDLVAGEQGIWSNFSDAGKHAIAGSAVANCRLHPRQTIHEPAETVYRSVRDVHIQLGMCR